MVFKIEKYKLWRLYQINWDLKDNRQLIYKIHTSLTGISTNTFQLECICLKLSKLSTKTINIIIGIGW